MLLPVAAVALAIAIVVWGADRFVAGAAALALNLGVSPLLIGLTIVGFGTSAPEVLVAAVAASQGDPAVAVGNAIGSNIANIGLILGITALVKPLNVHSRILKREYPLLLGVTLASFALVANGELSRANGIVLLAGLGGVLTWMVRLAHADRSADPLCAEYEAEVPRKTSTLQATGLFVVGLAALLISSKMLVWGAVTIALALGVPELVVGLTVVAVGTSLPELAASVAGALKNEPDIAIGNIVGSNLYNLLAVLSLPAVIAPGAVEPELLTRDFPVMLGLTFAMAVFGYGVDGSDRRINRFEGLLLLVAFVGYQTLLAISSLHPYQ